MEIIIRFLLLSSSILIFFSISTQSANSCKPESCGRRHGPEVRFPFQLSTRKRPGRCGYPGFELSCNSNKETILKLPVSGEFRVNSIDYSSQNLSMNYTGSCLPGGVLNFNLSGSPFHEAHVRNYAFLNCSSWEEIMAYAAAFDYRPIPCLIGSNFTVLATNLLSQVSYVPPKCRRIENVLVPAELAGAMALEEIELLWSDSACSYCEKQGRVCGYKDDSSLEIGCHERSRSSGLSRRAKYGLIIGVGIPGLVCIIGLVCHTCGLVKLLCLRRSLNTELPTVTVPDGLLVTNGLDMPTIESYPKTVLGESRRLPEPSDGSCPICLSEYQPKDTVRSIPECNHYFHVDCIDEWLKLNGSCPLCRNLPDGSTATPCSSLSPLSLITPSSTPSSGNL